MLQATEREFSALNTAKERRLKLTEEENLADVKSREEINTLKMAIEDKFQRDLEKLRFQRFESYFATEAEKLEHQNAERLAALDDALKAGAVTEQKYADLRVKINQKAALDIMQANARMYTALANIVDTAMGHISALVDSEGKKQFTIFKAISVATALVKGYEAVVSAFAAGNKVGGPPVGFAFAAIAAAGVAAQIAKLVSTDVGSGSGTVAPVAAGDTCAADAAAPLPNAGSTLTVQGISASSFFSGEQIRTIAEKLLQFQRDGGMVVLER
jgi:hypothetical protein